MTLDEYREALLERILEVDSQAGVEAVISGADETLRQSGITSYNRRLFWTDLYHELEARDEIAKRQGVSALSAIIAAAQAAIASHLASLGKQ